MKRIGLLFLVVAWWMAALGQSSSHQYVTVVAEPDHADWTYHVGETAQFTAYAIKENVRLTDCEITYSYGPDKQDAVHSATVRTGRDGLAHFSVPGATTPGFTSVRVKVSLDGRDYKSMTNIAFDPLDIRPTTTMPDDFEQYWRSAVAKASALPMRPTLRHSAAESNDRVDVYYVRLQSYREGTHVYGVLTVPKTPGRKPAILRLPGAAVRSYNGPHELAYEGFVVLEIGVHGIPVDQSPEVYEQLENSALDSYTTIGIDHRDTYYYKRVILGCVRAVDYLCTRDDVDTTRIATYGGSQGGMLSIMTAALSPRVSALFSYFPAYCELTAYRHGRGGGWPHLFRDPNEPNLEARMQVSRYYDTVNFARLLRVPGFYAWGYNDPACCPPSTYSAYNVITAPKQLQVGRDTGHWLYPWQVDNALHWLKRQFGME